jgi:hypothetical protein
MADCNCTENTKKKTLRCALPYFPHISSYDNLANSEIASGGMAAPGPATDEGMYPAKVRHSADALGRPGIC